jgi:hypothetical protein
LHIKSRDLVRRNAWAQSGIEAFVEVAFQVAQYFGTLFLDLGVGVAQFETHRRRRDLKLVEQVVNHRAI